MTTETADKLNEVMTKALFELKAIVDLDPNGNPGTLNTVKTFLMGVISTAIDLVEVQLPGSTPVLYADIESIAKLGGIRSIKKMQNETGSPHYSVSNIDEDDPEMAMNYLGQELSTALFKGLHELPFPLRSPEMMLRGIEALLTNLLNQRFKNSHQVLESFSEHVGMGLDALKKKSH